MEIRKAAHFWKAYNIWNLKTDICICVDAHMASILEVQKNGRSKI